MILEVAEIRVAPGQQEAFDVAIAHGITAVLSTAKGFRSAEVHRGVESPDRYVLHVVWETLEDHTVAFRGGPLFTAWRAIVGPFFVSPPVVEHFELVAQKKA